MRRSSTLPFLDNPLLVHAIGCVDQGDSFTRGGDRERALEYYGTAVDDCLAAGLYDVAAEVCGRMIDGYPDVVRARFTRAFLTLGKALRESAPDTLRRAQDELADYLRAAKRARQQLRAVAQLRLLAGATGRADVVDLIAEQLVAIGHPRAAEEVREEFRRRRPDRSESLDPRERWTRILLGAP